jgi:hypothetical protein
VATSAGTLGTGANSDTCGDDAVIADE